MLGGEEEKGKEKRMDLLTVLWDVSSLQMTARKLLGYKNTRNNLTIQNAMLGIAGILTKSQNLLVAVSTDDLAV